MEEVAEPCVWQALAFSTVVLVCLCLDLWHISRGPQDEKFTSSSSPLDVRSNARFGVKNMQVTCALRARRSTSLQARWMCYQVR